MDEIDPDNVRATLGELLQNFREAERTRDEAIARVETLQSIVSDMEEDRAAAATRIKDLHGEMNSLKEQKKQFEDHFSSSQTSLTLKVGSAIAVVCLK